MKEKFPDIKSKILDNILYKIVAVLVTLVLWLLVQSHQNTQMVQNMNLEFAIRPSHKIQGNTVRKVRVKLSGPRLALKKFEQSNETLFVSLNGRGLGLHKIHLLTTAQVELPSGTQLVSTHPQYVRVRIVKREQ